MFIGIEMHDLREAAFFKEVAGRGRYHVRINEAFE